MIEVSWDYGGLDYYCTACKDWISLEERGVVDPATHLSSANWVCLLELQVRHRDVCKGGV